MQLWETSPSEKVGVSSDPQSVALLILETVTCKLYGSDKERTWDLRNAVQASEFHQLCPLSEEGIKQAISQRGTHADYDHVFLSALPRTEQSARLALDVVSVEYDDESKMSGKWRLKNGKETTWSKHSVSILRY